MTSKPCSQKDKFTDMKEDLWKIFTELLHTNVSDEGGKVSTAVCPLFL
jgi:hypothetical protein